MQHKLNSGTSIPAIGLGTWRAQGDDVRAAVKHALEVGYRHIDTAVGYDNHRAVAQGIKDSSVPRKEVFLTTKIWNTAHTRVDAAEQIRKSLDELSTDYVDLLLIHWPWTYERNAEVYGAMEDAVDEGTVRSIGVSNFHIHHLNALLETARVKPVVNQVECHIHLQNTRLQEYLEQSGMRIEAYAPLKSDRVSEVLENETLINIGKEHGKTPAQVAIRWLVDRGIVVLPKSVNPNRIGQNFDVFDFSLSHDEMKAIRKLNRAHKTFPEPDNFDFGFLKFD